MKKIIKFEKSNCQPCLAVSDILDDAGIKYEAINPFDQPELATKFQVRSVPTVVVLDDEVEIERIIGVDVTGLKNISNLL